MSKEIVKRKKRKADWLAWSSVKGVVAAYYVAPCFGHGHGMYARLYIGTVGECLHPWNASSPLAKKEYDRKYKCWGRLVMTDQVDMADSYE